MWIIKKRVTMWFEIARFFSDHEVFIRMFRTVASTEQGIVYGVEGFQGEKENGTGTSLL